MGARAILHGSLQAAGGIECIRIRRRKGVTTYAGGASGTVGKDVTYRLNDTGRIVVAQVDWICNSHEHVILDPDIAAYSSGQRGLVARTSVKTIKDMVFAKANARLTFYDIVSPPIVMPRNIECGGVGVTAGAVRASYKVTKAVSGCSS